MPKKSLMRLVALCASLVMVILSGCSMGSPSNNNPKTSTSAEETTAVTTYKVCFNIDFYANLIFSKYDVDFKIDGKTVKTLSHGVDDSIIQDLTEGPHTITFSEHGSSSVKGEKAITVDKNMDVNYRISCYRDRVDVEYLSVNAETSTPAEIESSSQSASEAEPIVSSEATTEKPVTESAEQTKETEPETEPETAAPVDWYAQYLSEGKEIVLIPADVLFEYGDYYEGKLVATYITVEYIIDTSLYATTPNNTFLAHSSVEAKFGDMAEIEDVAEGSSVIVLGTVEMDHAIFTSGYTVVLKEAHLVSGVSADKIEAERDNQIRYAKDLIQKEEESKAKASQEEIQNYISSCAKVNYSDVERNPAQYKGKKIQVTGKVIQVLEGWLDNVTMRVEQNDGNVWYVTYKRKDSNESRILEGDRLTFYGECTGVESYTTLLGGQVTVPAMKAEYYR